MFFFFKQKTAYEMRISDWSSDVCSSDLQAAEAVAHRGNRNLLGGRAQFVRIASPPDYQQGETVRIMHIHHIHVSAAWIAMFAYASAGLVSAAALISKSRRRRPPRWGQIRKETLSERGLKSVLILGDRE